MSTLPLFAFLTLFAAVSLAQPDSLPPPLNSFEQDSVFLVLDSVNPSIPWRSLYPDDLCVSSPHGVVCEYLPSPNDTVLTPHITELSFGYVSDFSPNPPCGPRSTLSPSLFTSFPYLRKLFFYDCFSHSPVSFPGDDVVPVFSETLEELVFINNPSLVSSLDGVLLNFTSLRRAVLTRNGLRGSILPDSLSRLSNLEELTLSGNNLSGVVPETIANLQKLKVLDLRGNNFQGVIPSSIGRLTELVKLDISYNYFTGEIPGDIKYLQQLEFLDVSFNRFGNFGIPLFLGEMENLKEVYLSGNLLGGVIPEIFEKLGGLLGLGLSAVGLKGKIPSSLAVNLKSLCYLRLDNNSLEGELPAEFGMLERSVSEMNLENNELSGKLPFSANFTLRVGKKLKLSGNSELCVDRDSLIYCGGKYHCGDLGRLKLCDNATTTTTTVDFNSVLVKGGNFGAAASTGSSFRHRVLSTILGLLLTVTLFL